MKEPKVILKNVRTFRGREGYGLNADVWIDGVKCMFVIDDGNGGSYNYELYYKEDTTRKIVIKEKVKLLKQYITELSVSTGNAALDLDMYINDIYVKQEEAKRMKKTKDHIQQLQEYAIIVGRPDALEFTYFSFGKPLNKLFLGDLQVHINKIIQQHCHDGIVVLNQNLGVLGVILPAYN